MRGRVRLCEKYRLAVVARSTRNLSLEAQELSPNQAASQEVPLLHQEILPWRSRSLPSVNPEVQGQSRENGPSRGRTVPPAAARQMRTVPFGREGQHLPQAPKSMAVNHCQHGQGHSMEPIVHTGNDCAEEPQICQKHCRHQYLFWI